MSDYNGFIYETTCTVNGMKYRGRHGRLGNIEDPDDSEYIGSSLNPQFWVDLEKYGRDKFTREIIDPGPYTLEEAVEREGFRLREVDAANNPQYYNLSNWSGVHDQTGKHNPMYGKTWTQSEETRRKKSESLKHYEKTPEHCQHISESRKGKCTGDSNPMRDPEIAQKLGELLSGENNPMYGKKGELHPLYGSHYTWMTNGTDNRRASDEEVSQLESQGYYEGYTLHFNHSEEATKNRKDARAKAVYKRICKICDNEFEAKSGNARYCDICRAKREDSIHEE